MGFHVRVMPGKVLRLRLWDPLGPQEAKDIVAESQRLSVGWPRVPVLVDLSGMGIPPSALGKAFADEMQRVETPVPSRVAMVGASTGVRMVASFIVRLIPRYQDTRFFSDDRAAMDWLQEADWGR